MGFVDRTPEFKHLVAELSLKGEGPRDTNGQAASAQPQVQSELNAWAADIGTGIHDAGMQVQELRKMAKKKGIFNDKTVEIQDLTYSVKQAIEVLDQKIKALEQKARGTGPNKSYQVHTKNLVDTLKSRLLGVTKDLKDALEDRTRAMEQQEQRRSMYTSGQSVASNPFASRHQPTPSGNAADLEGGGGAQQAMAFQTSYQNSRAEAVQNVQRTIGELAQMFQQMAVLVTEQTEMVARIDDDVDTTMANVQQGQEHLLKYFKYISSNRSLIIKVFLILIFFVVFFTVFLA